MSRQARRVCECCLDRQPLCISTSHRRAAISLLNWSVVADGSSAKQRVRWRQILLASSPFACWPDRQTVCIRLAPKSSRKLARLVSQDLGTKRKAAAFVGKVAPASAGHTDRQWASASHGRAAASLLDWSVKTSAQRGRRQPLSASSPCECWQDRQTVCIRLALEDSRKLARLTEVSERLQHNAKKKKAAFVSKQLLQAR